MEIRCTSCQHVGEAARVEPRGAGVALICAYCGEAHLLEVSAERTAEPPQRPAVVAQADAAPSPSDVGIRALARLIPQAGEGLRCRKCAQLLEPDATHCSRCGLDLEQGFRYPPDEAPWERAPEGAEHAHERALLLWRAAESDWSEESASKFVSCCREEGLHEMAIRKLRFLLIERPSDPLAIAHLEELAVRLESRLVAARAQAEVSAQKLHHGLTRTRRVLTWSVAISCGIILMFFLRYFMDTRG